MTPDVSAVNIHEIERQVLSTDRSTWSERQDSSFKVDKAWTRKEIVTGDNPSSPIYVAESRWAPISAVCSPFISRMPDTFNSYWIMLGEGGKKIPCTAKQFSAVEQHWSAYEHQIETALQLLLANVARNPENYRWKTENDYFVAETDAARILLCREEKPGRFSRTAYFVKAVSKENHSIEVTVSGRGVKQLFIGLSRVA